MNWLAILLTLASLGGSPAPGEVKPRKQCKAAKSHVVKGHAAKTCKVQRKKKAKPKKKPTAKAQPRQHPESGSPGTQRDPDRPSSEPRAEATPTPTATPVATATPAPTPAPPGTYPSRTNVDLDEWFVRPSYRILAAGPIEFNVNNRGEDDHNLEIRAGSKRYGHLDVAPGDSGTLTVDLGFGSYVLYCSLEGHEESGMSANISVR